MSTYPSTVQPDAGSNLTGKIVKRFLQVGFQLLILAAALFLSSWRWDWGMAWAFVGVSAAVLIVGRHPHPHGGGGSHAARGVARLC
jgi:hypothetical protein